MTVGLFKRLLEWLRGEQPGATRRLAFELPGGLGFASRRLGLADPETRLLLGAHLIGPQASILIQPLVQAMCLGSTIDDVATGVLYIHPALTEVVEQALLGLGVEDDTAMPVHIKAEED
jgi:hypothetical protein